MDTVTEKPFNKSRVLKHAAVICAVLILAPFGIEGMLRLRQFIKHGTAAVTLYPTVIDPVSGLGVPAPGKSGRSIWINSRGFRSPEVAFPKPPGTIRIAFVGASTTFCAEVGNNDATWPNQVWKSLQEAWPAAHFDYVNAGVAGFSTTESLRDLQTRVKPSAPDVIVLYVGSTDLTKDTRKLAKVQHLPIGERGNPGIMAHSLAWELLQTNVKRIIRVKQSGKVQAVNLQRADLDSGEFSKGLRELVDEARKIAPVVEIATLSLKARKTQPPEQQQHALEWALYYMPFMTPDRIILAYDEYNKIIRDVATERSLILADGEDMIPGEDQYFKDEVHFTDAGCVLMAGRIVHALRESDSFRHLMEQNSASVQHAVPAKTRL